MTTVTQQRDIPEATRSLGRMDRPDYIDVFTVTTDGAADASPERWSRTAIEDVAGRGGQFVWRGVLGLRLQPGPSTERVGGWSIADRGEDWIRLEASSRLLRAHLVVRLHDRQLSVGTFIRYDHPIAALLWVPLSAVHRHFMPGLLVQTVRRRARVSPGAVRKEPIMTGRENANATLMLDIFSALERRDPQRLVQLCHPDVEFWWPAALPYGGTTRGFGTEPSSWIHTWAPLQPTEAERSMEPRVVGSNGDEVVVLWRQRGLSPSGERFDEPVLALYAVRDGRLARAQMFYFDTSALVEFLERARGRAA